MTDQIFCAGCGAPIQTEDEHQPGFAPASALKRDVIVCKRCFRLTHYNEVPDLLPQDEDFITLLNRIGESKALIVYLTDIFDFNGSWVSGLQRIAGKNDILLVGNKVDVLPKSTNHEKLKRWMRHMSKDYGLKPIDVYLISAEKGHGIEELALAIDHYRDGMDVFVVGCTNVGKSTFINQLIRKFGGDDRYKATTSPFPGTTLNFIELPLDDGRSLYDTPGIINHHQIAHVVTYDELKMILPKKEIKPKVYQLNEGQTLFFGGLARLDYQGDGRRSLICYMSNELYIHRTKIEKADSLYEEQVGELLKPPFDPEKKLKLVRHDLSLKEKDMDIVVSGLGWITVKGSGAKVSVYAPSGVQIIKRPSING
jgi:30S ribosome assembly GTPase